MHKNVVIKLKYYFIHTVAFAIFMFWITAMSSVIYANSASQYDPSPDNFSITPNFITKNTPNAPTKLEAGTGEGWSPTMIKVRSQQQDVIWQHEGPDLLKEPSLYSDSCNIFMGKDSCKGVTQGYRDAIKKRVGTDKSITGDNFQATSSLFNPNNNQCSGGNGGLLSNPYRADGLNQSGYALSMLGSSYYPVATFGNCWPGIYAVPSNGASEQQFQQNFVSGGIPIKDGKVDLQSAGSNQFLVPGNSSLSNDIMYCAGSMASQDMDKATSAASYMGNIAPSFCKEDSPEGMLVVSSTMPGFEQPGLAMTELNNGKHSLQEYPEPPEANVEKWPGDKPEVWFSVKNLAPISAFGQSGLTPGSNPLGKGIANTVNDFGTLGYAYMIRINRDGTQFSTNEGYSSSVTNNPGYGVAVLDKKMKQWLGFITIDSKNGSGAPFVEKIALAPAYSLKSNFNYFGSRNMSAEGKIDTVLQEKSNLRFVLLNQIVMAKLINQQADATCITLPYHTGDSTSCGSHPPAPGGKELSGETHLNFGGKTLGLVESHDTEDPATHNALSPQFIPSTGAIDMDAKKNISVTIDNNSMEEIDNHKKVKNCTARDLKVDNRPCIVANGKTLIPVGALKVGATEDVTVDYQCS